MTIPIPTLNSSKFYHEQKNQAIFEAHTKPSHFRPAHKNEVDFDHQHKYQVNFDPDTSQFLYIHQNQVPVGPHIDTTSISVPFSKSNSISIHTLKSSQL